MDSLLVKTLTKQEANLVAEGVFVEFKVMPTVIPQPGISYPFAVVVEDWLTPTQVGSMRIWANGFLKGLQAGY